MVLKRQISIQSKIEPPAKHVKSVPKDDLNKAEKDDKLHKKMILDNQNIVEELLDKNYKLEQDLLEMFSTNQDLENEMKAKMHELEAQVTDLKKNADGTR